MSVRSGVVKGLRIHEKPIWHSCLDREEAAAIEARRGPPSAFGVSRPLVAVDDAISHVHCWHVGEYRLSVRGQSQHLTDKQDVLPSEYIVGIRCLRTDLSHVPPYVIPIALGLPLYYRAGQSLPLMLCECGAPQLLLTFVDAKGCYHTNTKQQL